MEFVIITGMSGAGKTGALHVLEDIGYYCVDNLPSSLLSTLYRLCLKSEDDSMKRVAVVVDVRGNEKFEEMCSQIEHFKMHYENVKVLFFDAMTDRLVVRYKETRRRHPLSDKLKDGSVLSAVELERELLLPIKRTADYIYVKQTAPRANYVNVHGGHFTKHYADIYVVRFQIRNSA